MRGSKRTYAALDLNDVGFVTTRVVQKIVVGGHGQRTLPLGIPVLLARGAVSPQSAAKAHLETRRNASKWGGGGVLTLATTKVQKRFGRNVL